MKVLVCIPCLLTGGTEIQTLSLVEALVKAGHSPIVACYFEHNDDMVRRYVDAGADVRLLSTEGKRPIGVKNTIKFLWNGLRQIVKPEYIEVAHVQYMNPGALPVIILKMLGVRRILATTHTNADIYSNNGLRIIKFLTRNVLTAFQCITLRAENGYFGNSSLFDGNLRRHFTIYNCLPEYISIRTTPRQFNRDIITIGVVSRLELIKGMDLVIPAFEKAYQCNSNIRLLVVGDGSLRSTMEQQAHKSGLNDLIEFVGRQPQSTLQGYYDQIDVLLMPSRSEGFGLTAIEGMARGCVPVVANTGGLPEVVTTECGYLHKPDDLKDIADKILDASDIKTIADKSYNSFQCSRKFSSEKYYIQIRDLYATMR